MRSVTYALDWKHSSNLTLKALWHDSEGKGETVLASLKGWRAKMVNSAFEGHQGTWDEAMRVLVAMKGISVCKQRWGAERLLDVIKAMSIGEAHFWAAKMLADNKKAPSALKKLYGVS